MPVIRKPIKQRLIEKKTNYLKATTKLLILITLLCNSISFAQTATVTGKVLDSEGNAIENVNVSYKSNIVPTAEDGTFSIEIDANQFLEIQFSHINYQSFTKKVKVPKNRTLKIKSIRLEPAENKIEVTVKDQRNAATGIETIDIEAAKKVVGPNAGVENILKSYGSTSGNNELSSQYSVRGGNYDENLVYVNGIEVYRPFLVRSGQQEGLSFVNTDLTKNVRFSAGGFQAKYGDKLSSVLDITYKKPKAFEATANLSLLGGSVSIAGTGMKDKLSAILGVRYRDNSLLVNTKDIETNFKPKFTDVQTFLSYQFNPKWSLDFLGNFSFNQYDYTPVTRRTRFGTLSDPLELIVFYDGQEKDSYLTLFGALKVNYEVNEHLNLSLSTSTYNTQEEEYYDILAQYNLGEVNGDLGEENFGEVSFSEGIGSQLNHARNDLDALISNIQWRGTYKKGKNKIEFGAKYQREHIKDRIIEWEMIDSTGFSIRPPTHTFSNEQPYEAYEGPIELFQNIRATNDVTINRVSGYAQYSRTSRIKDHQLWYNIGVRSQYWQVDAEGIGTDNHVILSPRGQIAIKPDWEKDMLFRFSAGMYYQPPFYKELRDASGTVHPEVKAQNALHTILGMEYHFDLWERPFKLVAEMYYKDFWNVNPYTVDNVRIRYAANNNARAFASGFDMRLNGEFVPGTESWFSFGFLRTQENIDDRGYIYRPMDQRLKFGLLFQDYVPTIPRLKLYLNLVYNTGLPGGSPSYADPYEFQNRLNDYKRADVGLNFVLKDAVNTNDKKIFKPFREFSIGMEIFNIFDIQNSITNTWVRDIYSKRMYGIPNYMTRRVLNFKVDMKF